MVSWNTILLSIENVQTVSHKKKLTNVIIWEMHEFPHQFPILRENATTPIVWSEPGKLILILFPYYE